MKKLLSLLLALSMLAATMPALAATVVIERGDTLTSLANKYDTTVAALAALNGISNPNLIYAGQSLEVTGDNVLGASIPTVVALYTDSLASRMTKTDTSFTLVRGTDKQDRALNGFYGFVIDEGATKEEFVTANCSSTACTVVSRGIDVQDGETSITALKQEHRIGAVVKITNFPQLAILSRILDGSESASSTFRFGGGDTSQNKKLIADNGTVHLPFLQYNEGTQSWQYSDNGTDTVDINAGATGGLTASSTKGIGITSSKIYVNASSTGNLAFDSKDGSLYVVPTFSKAVTFNNTASITADNLQITGTANSASDAVNYDTLNMRILQGSATGTAKLAVTAGRALWVSSTSTLAHTNTSAASSTYQFVGVALNSAAIGAEVRYARPGETACGLSGLVPGMNYYLNGTAGQIATTGTTYLAKIGRAVNSKCLELTAPKFIARGVQAFSSVTTANIVTGFYPAHIEIRAAHDAAGGGGTFYGGSIGDDTNVCVYTTALSTIVSKALAKAWSIQDGSGTVRGQGTVSAKSATGFTLNCDTYSNPAGSDQIQWVAYSE